MTLVEASRLVAMGKHVTLGVQLYSQIKSDIVKCIIAPGARLTEAQVAEQYSAGRAAVRSALKMLTQEALVDALPRYGYVVAGHTEQDARDLFQLQMLLEPEAARLAAGRVNPGALRSADEECARWRSVSSLEDASNWLHANTRFHANVASYSGNALMARFVTILFEGLERQLYASNCVEDAVRLVAHDHRDLVDSLIAGDSEGAARKTAEQVHATHELLLGVFRQTGPRGVSTRLDAIPERRQTVKSSR